MTGEDRRRWDARYRADKRAGKYRPSALLEAYVPAQADGLALDLACGAGRHTLWLAAHGYRTLGVDVSRVALERAQERARQRGLAGRCRFAQVDLDTFRPPPGRLDVVCIFRFLNRPLLPAARAALRPGGLLIVETFNWRRMETHPDTCADYLLRPNELWDAFSGLSILHHSEDDDTTALVARRPHREPIAADRGAW